MSYPNMSAYLCQRDEKWRGRLLQRFVSIEGGLVIIGSLNRSANGAKPRYHPKEEHFVICAANAMAVWLYVHARRHEKCADMTK